MVNLHLYIKGKEVMVSLGQFYKSYVIFMKRSGL